MHQKLRDKLVGLPTTHRGNLELACFFLQHIGEARLVPSLGTCHESSFSTPQARRKRMPCPCIACRLRQALAAVPQEGRVVDTRLPTTYQDSFVQFAHSFCQTGCFFQAVNANCRAVNLPALASVRMEHVFESCAFQIRTA